MNSPDDDSRVRRPSLRPTVIAAAVLALISPRDAAAAVHGDAHDVCVTEGCVASAASVLANMDASVPPCDDFYGFACGGFTRDAHVDDDRTSRTTYSAVNDVLADRVRRMLEATGAAGPRHAAVARRLYGACADERRVDGRGRGPLLELIAAVGGWPLLQGDRWDGARFRWTDTVYRFRELGLSVDYLVDLSVKVNHRNTSEHVVELDRAVLALNPVYLKRGPRDKMVASYYRYMVDIAVALGACRARAQDELRRSLEFEIHLARISQAQSGQDVFGCLSVLTVSELAARHPSVPWREYINRLMCPGAAAAAAGGGACVADCQRVMVNTPGYLSGLESALRSTDRRVLANYMVWRAVASCVAYADRTLRDRQQTLHEELFGRPAREPRWVECVDVVSSGLYLAVGGMYVARHFDGRAKAAATDMVESIRKEMYDTLLNSDWMDPETKKNALDKAEAIDEFVAYPNELLDASTVDDYYVSLRLDENADYFESVLQLAKFLCDKNFEKLHVPVNKSDWVTHGRAAVVNAFYNLVENSIQFPAVNFDHFEILRAIGKGSFGKVCIVEKKDSRQMYAMKYMQKSRCIERDALKNVLREMEILTTLEHPFLVNLWFSFQDEEDLFMVSDLLLGGDLRYHLGQEVKFNENSIKLFACEIGSALEYLQSERIVHRDIKPENILLDEEGHAHITDFNIAATLHDKKLASSLSGTKPYIAPEVYMCSLGECAGYSYPVDWWSLGVTLYEVMSRCRPYDIHSGTTPREVRSMMMNSTSSTPIPPKCSEQLSVLFQRSLLKNSTVATTFIDNCIYLKQQLVGGKTRRIAPIDIYYGIDLLCINPEERITTVKKLKSVPCISRYNFGMILEKQIRPPFTPPKDRLNCDPTFELEEMIVEPNPLHRKPRRLAKQRSLRTSMTIEDTELNRQLQNFKCYNREKELERREMERKEHDWEQELIKAMNASTIPAIVPAMMTEKGNDLLTVPMITKERRRSSCKLNISPVSIQTRLLASQTDGGGS